MPLEPPSANDDDAPGSAAPSAPPKKPSIRLVDPVPTSVQQDLAAFHLGELAASVHDPDPDQLAIDTGSDQITSDDPVEFPSSASLLLYPDTSFPPASPNSQPAGSSSGPTFSALPDTTLGSAPSHRQRHRLVRIIPDISDSLGSELLSQPPPPFSWRFGFEWDIGSGHLLFDQERFVVQSEPVTTEDLSVVALLEGSDAGAETERASEASVRSAQLCQDYELILPDHLCQWLIEQLEDWYWRIYVPQGSGHKKASPGAGGNGYQSVPSGGSSSGTTPTNPTASQRPMLPNIPKKRDGDDDFGEDGGDDRRKRRRTTETKVVSNRRFACPYYKWKPELFSRICKDGFNCVSSMKQHLQQKHQPLYCVGCYREFTNDKALQKHRQALCATIPPEKRNYMFMINEQREFLGKRLPRKVSPEQQWQAIYRNLFPRSIKSPSPFLSGEDVLSITRSELEELLYDLAQGVVCQTLNARLSWDWIPCERGDAVGPNNSKLYGCPSALPKEKLRKFVEPAVQGFLDQVAGRPTSLDGNDGGLSTDQPLRSMGPPPDVLISAVSTPAQQIGTGSQNDGTNYVAETLATAQLSADNLAQNNAALEQHVSSVSQGHFIGDVEQERYNLGPTGSNLVPPNLPGLSVSEIDLSGMTALLHGSDMAFVNHLVNLPDLELGPGQAGTEPQGQFDIDPTGPGFWGGADFNHTGDL